MNVCACGDPATANGKECPSCFRSRISSVAHAKTSPAAAAKWNGRLERYRSTRAEGSQPAGTTNAAIDQARAASDETGQPFRADMWSRADG